METIGVETVSPQQICLVTPATYNNHRHNELAQMAADPDIQREIAAINAEFAVTETDGLTLLTDR